ncbi:MAG TPA: hypothetical protein P5148_18975, partial [Anaerolineae bacterium]|nr:hypothetical protein [Anaerolineae bacterium]
MLPDPRRDLHAQDPELFSAIEQEWLRQQTGIELIASENYVSPAVLAALGSVLTNKYAEGYPGKRYYGGCEFVDIAEELAIKRVKQLFDAEHANVQPHSGAQANSAAYLALIQPGDTVLALKLAHGGHLTHGAAFNSSGKFYNFVQYGVHPETECIDYDELAALADEHKPKLIVAGASAYRLDAGHRPLVAAFMAGVNRTAPLKFGHPGLGTTATSMGPRLVLQNDIGTTDAHVFVIEVAGRVAAFTYTDVHLPRLE